jgi:flagellar biosynthesis protein FlhF
MKVKRYVAPSSREAMAQVKKELGPDAVILSNRAAPGGVEILALAQDDVAGLVAAPAPRPAEERAQPSACSSSATRCRASSIRKAGAAAAQAFAARVESGTVYGGTASAAGGGRDRAQTAAGAVVDLRGELQPCAAWSSSSSPARWGERAATVAAQLMRNCWPPDSAPLGLCPAGCPTISAVPASGKSVLARNLLCAGGRTTWWRAGVYALVGPTGGTTTVAAGRALRALRAQKLALITTDSYGIGAQDQLRIYARVSASPCTRWTMPPAWTTRCARCRTSIWC